MEKNKDFLQILRNVDERINGKCTDEEWNKEIEAGWDESIGFLQDEFLKSRNSYAVRFAEWIALEDYIVVSESDLNVFWSKQTESVSKTTSQLLELFNEQDKTEKK